MLYELFEDDLFAGGLPNFGGTGPNTNFRIINNVFQIFDVNPGTLGFREVWFDNGVLQVGPSVP